MISKTWLLANRFGTIFGSVLLVCGLASGNRPLTGVGLILLGVVIIVRTNKLRCPHCRSRGLVSVLRGMPRSVACPNCGQTVHFE